jgi:hypothetical protein
MKWLLTIRAGADLEQVRRELARDGITVDVDSCIPLGEDEQVVEAEGPAELPAGLERADLGVLKVSPSSELELYDTGENEEGPGR